MLSKMYALKLIQGTEDIIIIYFDNIETRQQMIILLFGVRSQLQVSTWTETVDGVITDEYHYDDRLSMPWKPR